MKMRQIEAFRAVVECGSVTAAAERLSVSQPAVSKLIMELERTIDLRLFVRKNRRVTPTQEARLLYEEVERVFVSIDRIARYADDLRQVKTGQIHIASLPSLGMRVVPRIIARFAAGKPDAYLTMHVRTSAKITDWLLGQQIDLGISMLRIDHPSIQVESLAQVNAVCVLPPRHRLAKKKVVTPGDLHNERFIGLGREDRSGDLIARVFDDHSIARRIQLETNLSEVACRLVAAGAGVSIVDPFTAAQFSARELIVRDFRPHVRFEMFLLFPALRPRSKLLDSFVEALRIEVRRIIKD